MKKIYFFILIIFLALNFKISYAQDFYEYFNYSPRVNKKFDLSIVKNIKQDIKIFDDNLGKIFIWIDNPQEDNSIEVSLIKNNDILFRKIITVNKQKAKFSGNKFEINLGDNIKIKSGEIYQLVIKHLNGKNLYIYYVDKIQLLQGGEKESPIPKSLSNFYINDIEFPYNLKLALGEFKEGSSPEIFNAQVNVQNPYLTSIAFNANEPIKYRLIYSNTSTGDSFIYSSPFDFELCHQEIKLCKIDIFTQPDTNYYFQLTIFDYWGNFRIYEGSFKTPKDPNARFILPITTTSDTEPPEILNLQIDDITHNNIKVSFKTSELARSSMKIYYKETGVIVLEIRNSVWNLYHEIDAKNLLFPNLEYFAIITAEDFSQNQKETKIEFKTKPGYTYQNLEQFLKNPKTIEENKINYSNYEELKPVNLQANYNPDSNQFHITNESKKQNIEALFLNKNNYFSLAYQIKEKDYAVDLSVLSPGVYTYVIYEKMGKNTKRIIQTGDLEIKSIQKEVETTSQKKIEEKKPIGTKQETTSTFEQTNLIKNKSKNIFRYFLISILVILIFVLIVIKLKK